MKRILRTMVRRGRDEGGVILPMALFMLLILAALSAALLAIGRSEVQISANQLRGTQSLFVADGGLERAIRDFVATPDLVTNAKTDTVTLFAKGTTLGSIGTYAVTYRSIGPSTVLVSSTGESSIGGGQRTVDSVVTTAFMAKYALLGESGVKVKKSSKIEGELGGVHDNTKTEVKCDGTPCIEKTATSSTSKCTDCTSSHVGVPGSSGGNRKKVKVPNVKATDFTADYVMGDGTITDKTGTVVYNSKDDKKSDGWNGWTQGGNGEWVMSGDSPLNGTYYATKRIRITGNPGAPGAPWKATLLAGSTKNKGTVDIRGAAIMEPAISGLLIVAGKVKVKWEKADEDGQDADDKDDDDKGKKDDDGDDDKDDKDAAKEDDDDEKKEKDKSRPRSYVELKGTIFATSHKDKDKDKGTGRVKLSGDVRLTGNIVAKGRVEVKGSTVTYNGSGVPNIVGDVQVIAWGTRGQ